MAAAWNITILNDRLATFCTIMCKRIPRVSSILIESHNTLN